MDIGSSRCNDNSGRINWFEEQWRNGEACRETCNHYAKAKGPGCCEARPRDPIDVSYATRSFCGYVPGGRLTYPGHKDTKATLCSGDYYKRGKKVSSIGS